MHALEWVKEVIQAPLLFLLVLNLLLIVVGALMDIYSAIIVNHQTQIQQQQQFIDFSRRLTQRAAESTNRLTD